MAAAVQLYSGGDAVRAAEKLRQLRANQEQWPYPHVYAPANSIPVNETGAVVTPALAAQAVALTYQVPSGFRFVMAGVVLTFINSGGLGAFVPGQALWTVDVNTPVGIANVQASPVQGLTNVKVPLGSFLAGNMWTFARSYEFEPLDILRAKARNVALGVGDPNWFAAGFFGWLLPAVLGK